MKYRYTKINNVDYFNWVKKLRQAHLHKEGTSTLCGMYMLGNNYADIYTPDIWSKCKECYSIALEGVQK